MFSPLHFSPIVTNLFFFLFTSFISSHSLSFQLLFILFLYKSLCPLSHSPHNLTSYFLQSQLLSQTISSPSMVPNSRKSSYVLPIDILHLTHWNGVVSLTAAPPLAHKSQQHISEGARTGLVNFLNFPHFWSFPLIFILIHFSTCKCLGFALGWV